MRPHLQPKEDLEAYITMMEEAKKRDHRKLGKELTLFMMHDAGPGFPFFLPKGMVLKNTCLITGEKSIKSWLCRDFHSDHPESPSSGRLPDTGIITKTTCIQL